MKLIEFYEQNRPRKYHTGWHHRVTCDMVERCYRERKFGIIEEPPRHGKSEIVNIYAPAWWIQEGHVTDSHFGLVCNGQALADKFSRASRNLCKLPVSPDHTSEWRLASDKGTDWTYRCTGINGSLAGFGYSEMAFDDLFKNGQEAKSEKVRNNIIDGVVSQAMNRLTPDGILIAMQARLHPSDTIGWLLEQKDMKFLRLHLPATNDDGRSAWFEDQYAGTKVVYPAYDALWPEQYNRESLEAIFARITTYYKHAQFMQVPSLGDLSFFDVAVMPRYTLLGTITKLWIAVDCAQTETETGAYTAFVCLAQCCDGGNHLKVLHVKRGRWRPDVIAAELIDYYNAMQRRYGVYPEAVCVEKAAAGYGLLNLQMPIVPMTPRGDKEERAGAVCWLVNRGLVQLPTEAPWLKDFVDELENFPLTTYKDQVDAFVHALAWELRKNVDFDSAMMGRYAALQPCSPEQQFQALVSDIEAGWEEYGELGF
jgi:predicted phage terminase large subunit-like protein